MGANRFEAFEESVWRYHEAKKNLANVSDPESEDRKTSALLGYTEEQDREYWASAARRELEFLTQGVKGYRVNPKVYHSVSKGWM